MPERVLSRDVLAVVAAVAVALAFVQTLRLTAARVWRRRRIAMRQAHALAGETRADALLRAIGYSIVGRQVSASYPVRVDGAPLAIGLRADYIVARDARRYVAEVKTGRRAPRIDTAATRRQLLEYKVALDVDGVLLVDPDAGEVHAIEFPTDARPSSGHDRRAAWLVAGIVTGALLTSAVAVALR